MNDPQPEHVAAAAAELDRIRAVAEKMTVASSEIRQILFELTKAPVNCLLKLNEDHFENSRSIRGRIAVLAQALLKLRNLNDGNIPIDRSDGFGDCPYCETPINRSPKHHLSETEESWLIYCPQCDDIYASALEKLTVHGVGFGTEKI